MLSSKPKPDLKNSLDFIPSHFTNLIVDYIPYAPDILILLTYKLSSKILILFLPLTLCSSYSFCLEYSWPPYKPNKKSFEAHSSFTLQDASQIHLRLFIYFFNVPFFLLQCVLSPHQSSYYDLPRIKISLFLCDHLFNGKLLKINLIFSHYGIHGPAECVARVSFNCLHAEGIILQQLKNPKLRLCSDFAYTLKTGKPISTVHFLHL